MILERKFTARLFRYVSNIIYFIVSIFLVMIENRSKPRRFPCGAFFLGGGAAMAKMSHGARVETLHAMSFFAFEGILRVILRETVHATSVRMPLLFWVW